MSPGTTDNTVDLDCDLPALPLELCFDLPPNIFFKLPPPGEGRSERLASFVTSPTTPMTARGRQHFRSITRDLLRSPTSPLSSSPTSSCGQSDFLDPVKQELPVDTTQQRNKMSGYAFVEQKCSVAINAGNLLIRHRSQSFGNVSSSSNFLDEQFAQVENFFQNHGNAQPSPAKSIESSPNKDPKQPKGMSQSRSESWLHYDGVPTGVRTPIQTQTRPVDINDFFYRSPAATPTRGRLPRTPSPTKLDNIVEDQSTDDPPSPIKRSRSPVKQLFGEHGWLGRSTSMKEKPSEEFRKSAMKRFTAKVKQRVGELVSIAPSEETFSRTELQTELTISTLQNQTEDVSKKLLPISPPSLVGYATMSTSPIKMGAVTTFPVSLAPPEQAKLFSEVELMICCTANKYLQRQHEFGRLSVASVARVAQSWTSKNRPQVMEFMYDQQTQHELVTYNLKTFHFYGPQAEDVIALNSMMLSWKQLGKDMSVRTFCTPDSAVKKILNDSNMVLQMLGARNATFRAFQLLQYEVFNLIQERQERAEKDARTSWGVEKRWEPSESELVDEELNPFK